MAKEKGKENKILRRYWCRYCGHLFEKYVGTYGDHTPHKSNNKVSSQVKCPKCGNGLKTWEDGVDL